MNNIAVVTGAARGIGLRMAARLAEAGFSVVAADRDGSVVETEAAKLRAQGLDVRGVGLDITDRAAVAAVFNDLGAVQVLVNNAAIASTLVPIKDMSEAELVGMLKVNVQGTFIVAQEAARRMADGGSIINVASRGYLGGAGAAHYVASKAAVVGLTRAMAVELRWSGIAVNAIAPGMVETRMIQDFTDDMRRALVSREPSGRAADPDDIARAVVFLATDTAHLMNGQVLLLDGGKSIGVPPL